MRHWGQCDMESPGPGRTGGHHPGVGAACELGIAAGGELGHQHAGAVGGLPRCWEVGPRRSELGVSGESISVGSRTAVGTACRL